MRPPPQPRLGLTDVERQQVNVTNARGTEYTIKMNDPDFDKWVCTPGKDFIDTTGWVQELFIYIGGTIKNKTKGKK